MKGTGMPIELYYSQHDTGQCKVDDGGSVHDEEADGEECSENVGVSEYLQGRGKRGYRE